MRSQSIRVLVLMAFVTLSGGSSFGASTQPRQPRSQASILAEFETVHTQNIGVATVAYRRAGTGPAIVLVHGFPLSGLTWKYLVSELAHNFTCYAFDVIGFGDSSSPLSQDFASQGQAILIAQALQDLNVRRFGLIGNDSGGWIAREVALLDPAKVTSLLLTNTEMPGHRPPAIPQYQALSRDLPEVTEFAFKELVVSPLWLHSPEGFGEVFADHTLVDGDFWRNYLAPLEDEKERRVHAVKFLQMMDFKRVDAFAMLHGRITMPVLLLWGDADKTFPYSIAQTMVRQFPHAKIEPVIGGKLFMHEEAAFRNGVAKRAVEFFKTGQ